MITDDEVRKVYTEMFVAALAAMIPPGMDSARRLECDYEDCEILADAAETVASYGVARWAKSLNDGALQIPCEELGKGVNKWEAEAADE